jgi:uncharacterized protein YdaL
MNRTLGVLLMLVLSACAPAGVAAETKRVRIYYDRVPDAEPAYHFGRIHALFLQNLLGHFPNVQQEVVPIQQYQSGDLDGRSPISRTVLALNILVF